MWGSSSRTGWGQENSSSRMGKSWVVEGPVCGMVSGSALGGVLWNTRRRWGCFCCRSMALAGRLCGEFCGNKGQFVGARDGLG